MSKEFDNTFEFDPTSGDQDTPRFDGVVLYAVITSREVAGPSSDGGIKEDLVLKRWMEIARDQATVARRQGETLTCTFASAQAALDSAKELRRNLLFSTEIEHRMAIHDGPLGPDGECVSTEHVMLAAAIAQKANPDWLVTTRAVYDRLPIEYQMELESLDFVSLARSQPPTELFQVDDGNDLLRTSGSRQNWGPYARITLNCDDAVHVMTRDSEPLTVGRGKSNEIRLEDMFVSVQHARIEFAKGEFVLIDSSSNGTYVAADGEPAFRSPPRFKLRKPGSIGFGRPPGHASTKRFGFHFD